MDFVKLIDELKAERQQIEMAIAALEHLAVTANGGKKRRGRPPLWMSELKKREDKRAA